MSLGQEIPNLDLSHLAGRAHADDDMHYEALGTLANLLGRSMSMHRHDRYFQVHYVRNGTVRVQMDDRLYCLEGPMFFLTPPAFPHAFVTDDDADGHVLTVRQQLVWPALQETAQAPMSSTSILGSPICLAANELDAPTREQIQRLDFLFEQLRAEYTGQQPGRNQCLLLLTQLIFVSLLRLSPQRLESAPSRRADLQLFQQFNMLIEAHFREHWTVPDYARALGVTGQRLNDISRRVAGKSSKRLTYDRVIQEARRLLLFTGKPVNEICYSLGFRDPAYFSRFFQQQTGQVPGSYRTSMSGQATAQGGGLHLTTPRHH